MAGPFIPRDPERGATDPVDDVDLETSVADWAIERPEAAGVFEQLGIDYSCAGKSLRYACRERGLDPQDVLRHLDRAAQERRRSD